MKRAKNVDLACQKARARKAESVHSNMTLQRKGKAKGIDQEAKSKDTIQQNDKMPEGHGQVHLEKMIVLRVFNYKRGSFSRQYTRKR